MATYAFEVKVAPYFYIFPEYAQGRKVIWDGMDEEGNRFINYIPKEIIASKNKQEMKIDLINGSYIQIIGSADYDKVRGVNGYGFVFSEFAYQSPRMWEAVVRPIIEKNGGWAIFQSTPQGRNHFHDMYNMSKQNQRWYSSFLTINDTGLVTEDQINELRKEGMSEELIQQEFYCSFDIGVQGAYYGNYIAIAEKENRIGHVPYDSIHLVYTSWDIGIGDSCAIIFFQLIGNQINIIDHLEDRGKAVTYYINQIKLKPYQYGIHFMPHDAFHRDFITGCTPADVADQLGLCVEKVPETTVEEGIEKTRGTFSRVFFDKNKCDYLIKCLLQYHSEYDERAKVYRNRPYHDWSSHSADAFRYLALSVDNCQPHNRMSQKQLKDLKKAHGYK